MGGAGGRKRKRPHQLSSNVVALPPEKYGCFIFVFKAVLTKVFGLGVLERANPAISELTDFPIFFATQTPSPSLHLYPHPLSLACRTCPPNPRRTVLTTSF